MLPTLETIFGGTVEELGGRPRPLPLSINGGLPLFFIRSGANGILFLDLSLSAMLQMHKESDEIVTVRTTMLQNIEVIAPGFIYL